MLNTTFFTAMLGLTFLCVDPISKAVYVVRVFQGESLRSGEDLRAALKPFAPVAGRLAVWLIIFVTFAGMVQSRAQTASPTTPPEAEPIQPKELDRAIDDVIQRRKYTWRLPREKVVESSESEPGVIAKFFQRVGQMIRDALRWIGNLIEKIFRSIFGRFARSAASVACR